MLWTFVNIFIVHFMSILGNIMSTDSHLKEKNVRGGKTSLHKILIIGCSSVGPPNISFKVQRGGMPPILIDGHLLTGTFATLAFNLSPLQFFSALQCAFSKYTMHLYQIVCSTYIAIFACFLFCLWILCLIGLDFECCILSMTIKMSGKCRDSIMESSWCDWLDLQDKWCHCNGQQTSSH